MNNGTFPTPEEQRLRRKIDNIKALQSASATNRVVEAIEINRLHKIIKELENRIDELTKELDRD